MRQGRRLPFLLVLPLVLALLAGALPLSAATVPVTLQTWYAKGDFNGWGNDNPMYDDGSNGDVIPGDGIYTAEITIGTAGRYEFKVATEDWSTAYPSDNAWLYTSADGESVTFTFDTNTYADGWLPETNLIGVTTDPAAWTAVGDWQGWNNSDPPTAMTAVGGGVYEVIHAVTTPGSHEYKAVLTGTWDAVGSDGRNKNAPTALFDTTVADQLVLFRVDAYAGRVYVEVLPPFEPEWYAKGDFNGWTNDHPMWDDGSHGDVTPGDGIHTVEITLDTTGRYEFKVAAEDWSTAYPSGNAWFYTSADGESVTFTFDTNTYPDGWLPETNLIGVTTDPGDWTAVGDWQGWDNSDPSTAMTAVGGGVYEVIRAVATPGSHEYKAVLTGTWDAVGSDGRNMNAPTALFDTTELDQQVIFRVDAFAGRIYVEVVPTAVPVWFARGDFNGWNLDHPMYDDGSHGDPVPGDGIYTAEVFIADSGRYEFKVADEDFSVSFPGSGNSWLETTSADETVTVTFDTNTYADGWLPESNIIGVSTEPGDWTAAGDWQGWDNSNPDTLMTGLGGGHYQLATTIASPGIYQFKAVKTGFWDAVGADGRGVNSATAGFETTTDDQNVTFTVDALAGRILVEIEEPPPVPGHDNDIWWDGLGHNSRAGMYRIPWGAVTTGTAVVIRFRTFRHDVTDVTVRLWSTTDAEQTLLPMELVATTDDEPYGYDWWQVEFPGWDEPTILYYRFIVRDGDDVAYYEDDDLLDGSWGTVYDESPDYGWQIDVYLPEFETPDWMKNAVVYQIFPDRFYNGNSNRDPDPTDPTVYGNEVLVKGWGDLPEGYCRAYEDFVCEEDPLGRDFFGGDLDGVKQKLDYLQDLGVTAIYFNPIFMAPSNHLYDTTTFNRIDPYFGSIGTFRSLVQQAGKRGIRVILDGVFNHTSSDSIYFDKYSRYPKDGAYESQESRYYDWYTFYEWPDNYNSWWGFDSLPVLTEIQEVKDFIYERNRSVARWWIMLNAAGWRLDVAPDKSHEWWQEFRPRVKSVDPDAVILGEFWDDASPWLLGDEFDSTMNYRFRRALIGFVNGETNDPNQGLIRDLNPWEFNSVLQSIREDYPKPAFDAAMNLVGTHDTQRILWALTPGARNREEKEFDPVNLAEGKAKQELLAIIQMTMPGAPTIYYGDEVALTGDTDPDDRRPFPWDAQDAGMLAHYQALTGLRNEHSFLRIGNFSGLYTNNDDGTYAYGRRDPTGAAVVAVNRDTVAHDLRINTDSYIPEGTVLTDALNGGTYEVVDGHIGLSVAGRWGAILITPPGTDLTPPPAPTGLTAVAGNGFVDLAWDSVPDVAGYYVYRSPVAGGGFVPLNQPPLLGTTFTDDTVVNGRLYYYVVRAVDDAGNRSTRSNEANALPALIIGWANLQWPPNTVHEISATDPTENIYGQVWIDGYTSQPGPTEGLVAQVGYGPDGSYPEDNPDWLWFDAAFNTDAGDNDEFVGQLIPEAVGVFDYAYRFSTTAGQMWLYADLDGTGNGYDPTEAGDLTVNPSGDTTPPAAPANLALVEATPSFITMDWDPVADPDLFQYKVYRSDVSGGPYGHLGNVAAPDTRFTDWNVIEDTTYYYVVQSVDTSFNRSVYSNELEASAQAREVQVTFNATLPDTTPPIGDPTGDIYIGGSFNGWDPGGTVMDRTEDYLATLTLTFIEGEQLAYKYTRGSWDYVEKDAACNEIPDRTVTVFYGDDGSMVLEDTILNWRNTGPCGP